MNSGGMSHLCCRGPAGLQCCCCCSLPQLRAPCNWGQQQTVAPAVNRWRATRNTLCQRASQILDENRGGLGAWCCSWGLFLLQEGISLQLGPSLFCPRPISALHPCSGWSRIEASFPSFSHSHTARPDPPPTLASWTLILPPYDGPLEILFSQPTTFCLMALLCQSRPFLLHSSANLQAACVGTDFLTTPNDSLLISVK